MAAGHFGVLDVFPDALSQPVPEGAPIGDDGSGVLVAHLLQQGSNALFSGVGALLLWNEVRAASSAEVGDDATVAAATDTGAAPPAVLNQVVKFVRSNMLRRGSNAASSSPPAAVEPAEGAQQQQVQQPQQQQQQQLEVERVNFSRFEQEFERISLIGRGAFGEVWHCRRREDGRESAIKVVRYRAGGVAGRGVEQHILREAQMLSQTRHPNILRHYKSWIEPEWPYGGNGGSAATPGQTTPVSPGVPRQTTPASPGLPRQFAPPSSPMLPTRIPSELLEEFEGALDGSSCCSSYHGDDSIGSDVVFEWQDEEEAAAAAQEEADEGEVEEEEKLKEGEVQSREEGGGGNSQPGAPLGGGASSTAATATPGRAAGGGGYSPGNAAAGPGGGGGGGPRLLRLGSFSHEDPKIGARTAQELETGPEFKAALFIQVELCREDTLQGWIAARNALCGSASSNPGLETSSGASSPGSAGCQDDEGQPWARKATSTFFQIARALAYLHERACVHRDVKPSNILFAQDGTARLGDFGLAKVLEETEDVGSPSPPHSCTAEASKPRCGTVGTPCYASPEQLTGGALGGATDVYALGLVLAELICPVQTQMERAAVLEGLRQRHELPSAAVRTFPTLSRLAVRMTDADPARRPSAAAILSKARQARREARRVVPRAATDGLTDGALRKASTAPLPALGDATEAASDIQPRNVSAPQLSVAGSKGSAIAAGRGGRRTSGFRSSWMHRKAKTVPAFLTSGTPSCAAQQYQGLRASRPSRAAASTSQRRFEL